MDLQMIREVVKVYRTCMRCECGGKIIVDVNKSIYLTSPPRKDFGCDSCEKVYRLSENQFPNIIFD